MMALGIMWCWTMFVMIVLFCVSIALGSTAIATVVGISMIVMLLVALATLLYVGSGS